MVPLAVNVMDRRACFQLPLLKSFNISNYLWAFKDIKRDIAIQYPVP